MIVTATEFKNRLGSYLEIVKQEDIYVTSHGAVTAVLTRPVDERVRALTRLKGILNEDIDLDLERQERLSRL